MKCLSDTPDIPDMVTVQAVWTQKAGRQAPVMAPGNPWLKMLHMHVWWQLTLLWGSATYRRPAPSVCPLGAQEGDVPSHIIPAMGELWKTVNSSVFILCIFWTGGCKKLHQGPTALLFQEGEECSHHLISQCCNCNAVYFRTLGS